MNNKKSDFLIEKTELNNDEKLVFLRSIKYDLHLIEKYHDFENESVKLAILQNPNTPLNILKKMYDKNQDNKRLISVLVSHRNISSDILEIEIKKPFDEIIQTIGSILVNPNLDTKYIIRYSKDSIPMLKGSRLSNPSIPKEILLEEINKNPSENSTVIGLVLNPNTPKSYIDKVGLNTTSRYIKISLVKNLSLSDKVYERLVGEEFEIQKELSLKQNIPLFVLKKLSKHEDKNIRNNVRLNGNSSSALLREIIDNDKERLVKTNRYSSLELREDGHKYLKGVRENEKKLIRIRKEKELELMKKMGVK